MNRRWGGHQHQSWASSSSSSSSSSLPSSSSSSYHHQEVGRTSATEPGIIMPGARLHRHLTLSCHYPINRVSLVMMWHRGDYLICSSSLDRHFLIIMSQISNHHMSHMAQNWQAINMTCSAYYAARDHWENLVGCLVVGWYEVCQKLPADSIRD